MAVAGEIIERVTHDELLQGHGFYFDLLRGGAEMPTESGVVAA